MTDRVKGFVVTLKEDMREDDAQALIDAISLLYNVADVSASVTNPDDHMNRARVHYDLTKKLLEVTKL